MTKLVLSPSPMHLSLGLNSYYNPSNVIKGQLPATVNAGSGSYVITGTDSTLTHETP